MAEIWNIPGRQRPRFWARQVRGLLLLLVFAVGLAATSLLTWLGSYGGKAVAVALANLAAAAAVNAGLFLLAFRVLTPRQVPTRQLLAGALVAGVLDPGADRAVSGRPYVRLRRRVRQPLVGRNPSARVLLTDHLPMTRRMLGVDLDGSRRIEPAHVGCLVGLDASRRIVWMIKRMIKGCLTESDAKASK
jgi:hypothetical protein